MQFSWCWKKKPSTGQFASNLFFILLGVKNLRIKVPAGFLCNEGPLSNSKLALSCYILIWQKKEQARQCTGDSLTGHRFHSRGEAWWLQSFQKGLAASYCHKEGTNFRDTHLNQRNFPTESNWWGPGSGKSYQKISKHWHFTTVCEFMCVDQKSILGTFLNCFPFLRQDLLLNLYCVYLARLASSCPTFSELGW